MTKRSQLEREIEALESKIAVIDLIESARDDDGKFILKVGFMGCKKSKIKSHTTDLQDFISDLRELRESLTVLIDDLAHKDGD